MDLTGSTFTAYLVLGPQSETSIVDPEVHPYSSATLLRRILETVHLRSRQNPCWPEPLVTSLPNYEPSKDLVTASKLAPTQDD